jgi:outer membrane protein assembly factor BamE
MLRNILIPALLLSCCLVSGCSVYRPTIQQGNILDRDEIAKLKPGMSRRQVIFVVGTPLLEDPFHHDRWDYVHTVKNGKTQLTTIQHLTLYFKNDVLERIDKSRLDKTALR